MTIKLKRTCPGSGQASRADDETDAAGEEAGGEAQQGRRSQEV